MSQDTPPVRYFVMHPELVNRDRCLAILCRITPDRLMALRALVEAQFTLQQAMPTVDGAPRIGVPYRYMAAVHDGDLELDAWKAEWEATHVAAAHAELLAASFLSTEGYVAGSLYHDDFSELIPERAHGDVGSMLARSHHEEGYGEVEILGGVLRAVFDTKRGTVRTRPIGVGYLDLLAALWATTREARREALAALVSHARGDLAVIAATFAEIEWAIAATTSATALPWVAQDLEPLLQLTHTNERQRVLEIIGRCAEAPPSAAESSPETQPDALAHDAPRAPSRRT